MENNHAASPLSSSSQNKDKEFNGQIQDKLDILNSLLDEIPPINVREYLELPDDVEARQKHIIVAVVKHLFRRRSKTVPLAGLKQCHPQGTVFR